MSTISATDAKNRFGQLLEMAQAEPVEIQKSGRTVGVLISPEEYAAFEAFRAQPKVRPQIDSLLKESVEKRRSLYKALAR